MSGKITFQGNPLTLVGRVLKIGGIVPDFRVSSFELKEVKLNDFAGKIKVITTFPSLDTPVCDLQLKEFNKQAVKFSSDVVVLGISKDLPFAQKRFCQDNQINNVQVVSDYKSSSFGINYGLLIKELNLLARSVLILDKNNVLRYFQIVPELTKSPNYKEALENLEKVINNPVVPFNSDLPGKCKPCEEGALPLPKEKIEKLILKSRGWEIVEDKKLVKELKFADFKEAKYFLDIVSLLAEEQQHHPVMTIMYNKLRISLSTHAAGGLTENDFIMAKFIDQLEA